MPYWTDKVALITGGSGGLGSALGEAFAAAGAKVVLSARDAERLESVAAGIRQTHPNARERMGTGSEHPATTVGKTAGREVPAPILSHPPNVLAVAADVTRQADVENLLRRTIDEFGRLDVLVNAAGRSARGQVIETTPEEFAELLELNFLSVVRCVRAAVPHLLQTRGHLVNISSLAGKAAIRYVGAYPASKFALAAYTQQLRLELSPNGLHVLLVSPGPIARPDASQRYADQAAGLPERARKPGAGVKFRAIRPADLSHAILRACERRRPELIYPPAVRLLLALGRFRPD